METLLGRTYTGPELAEAAGLTYRRVDYYTRIKLLAPLVHGFAGPGSRREYNEDDLARVRLIGALRDLGAEIPIIARVLDALASDPRDWPEFFFVTPDGTVKLGLPLPASAWWIQKRHLLDEFAPAA